MEYSGWYLRCSPLEGDGDLHSEDYAGRPEKLRWRLRVEGCCSLQAKVKIVKTGNQTTTLCYFTSILQWQY